MNPIEPSNKTTQEENPTGQARCYDLPNDAEEGHYWSWVNAPNSIPKQYRHCMICDRIDASEWLASQQQSLLDRVEAEVIDIERDIFFTKDIPTTLEEYMEHAVKTRETLRVEQRKALKKLRDEYGKSA